jgi:hypothetical protein
LAAEAPQEPSDREDDFVAYLARRLGIEAREARQRLSAWLNAYEPAPKSGPRRAIPRAPDDEVDALERSA